MCPPLPQRRGRVGTNSVSAGPRLGADYGKISRLQTAIARGRETTRLELNLFSAEEMSERGLKITLGKKTCFVFNLGNLLWLETVKVALP